MKHVFLILTLLTNVFMIYAQGPCGGTSNVVVPIPYTQCSSDKWVLYFEDNFNEKQLNLSNWEPQTGVVRDIDFTGQKAYHKPDNAVTEDGLLKIISKKETLIDQEYTVWLPDGTEDPRIDNFDYSTAEICTKQKFLYGIFEARIKIPKGKGFFPAFWLYSSHPWNEIDIFEFKTPFNALGNYEPENLSKIHKMNVLHDFDNDGKKSECQSEYTGSDFSTTFHTFTLIWEKDKIEWYVDGQLKRRDTYLMQLSGANTGCYLAAGPYYKRLVYPNKPMSIILNTAIQNNQSLPDASTVFPNQMEVEYVRYYKRNPNPCQDINITNISQLPLSDQEFNGLVGNNVNINCSYIVPSGYQLDIIAGNSITLGPGFSTEENTLFCARIEPSVCN